MNEENIKELTKGGIITALYIVLTLINPIGSGAIQFRVSEALAVLPFFNKKYTLPILLGVAIANTFSPLGIIDIAFGLATGIITYTLARFIKHMYVKGLLYAIVCGGLIGLELNIVLGIPYLFTSFCIFTSQLIISIISIFVINRINKKYTL